MIPEGARASLSGPLAGLDIGGTKIDAVAVDAGGHLLGRVRVPTAPGAEGVLESAAASLRLLQHNTGLRAGGFGSVGVGIPGAVDPATGRVLNAVNLGLSDLEFGAQLGARLGLAVRVENDVTAAALGAYELARESRPGLRSLAYLSIGTGLAAGFVLDGRLWRGSRGGAGEIGHLSVRPDGEPCPCGQRGCLETVLSGPAIARRRPSADRSPLVDLLDAAGAGDAEAAVVRADVVGALALAVRLLVLTVDVELVLLGRGVSAVGESLLAALREALDAAAVGSPFLSSLELPSRVDLLPPSSPAAAVGAALVGAGRGIS
jgi:predicted NBD/HSP70 family sugar kinase